MEKIEATILGSAAGSTTQPQGLAYNVAAEEISDYSYLTAAEADIESYNFSNIHFIASPHFKGDMKAMVVNDHRMAFEDGKIDSVLQGKEDKPLTITKVKQFLELNQIGE